MPELFLLFSHKLTGLQMTNAIENLKISKFNYLPEELQNSWSRVDPGIVSLFDYAKPFKRWLEKAKKGDYALIQGDYGLAYIIVNYCLARGIIPVYSTSERVSEDAVKGNDVEIKRLFRHRIFRRYEYEAYPDISDE